jgi:hypothetical protein
MLRRAGIAKFDGGGRGCTESGKDRDGADQCAARVAPMWPSGGVGMDSWLGDQAGAELTVRLRSGGHLHSCSCEQTASTGK